MRTATETCDDAVWPESLPAIDACSPIASCPLNPFMGSAEFVGDDRAFAGRLTAFGDALEACDVLWSEADDDRGRSTLAFP